SFGRVSEGGAYRKPSGGLGANRGAVYAVCGCSGEGGVDEGFPLHPAMALNHGGFGSMVIDVDGLRLTGRFLRPSQVVDDEFTIDKTGPTTFRPRVEIARGTNGTAVTRPTSNPNYSLQTAEVVTGAVWRAVDATPQT